MYNRMKDVGLGQHISLMSVDIDAASKNKIPMSILTVPNILSMMKAALLFKIHRTRILLH